MFGLGGPNLMFAKYLDFFDEFINRYIDESTVTSFNKTELGLQVKELHRQLMDMRKEEIHEDPDQN